MIAKKVAAGMHDLEGAVAAPILMFEEVPVFGVSEGFCRLTLSAYVQDVTPDGQAAMHKVAVAHLRGSPSAFRLLRAALDGIDQIAAGPVPQGETKN